MKRFSHAIARNGHCSTNLELSNQHKRVLSSLQGKLGQGREDHSVIVSTLALAEQGSSRKRVCEAVWARLQAEISLSNISLEGQ